MILENFPQAKIINTYIVDKNGNEIIKFLSLFKNKNIITDINLTKNYDFDNKLIVHDRVLNIPFGCLFNEESYNHFYDQIISFLSLKGRLIAFDYIKYYLSKQHPDIQSLLEQYTKNICLK